MIKTLWIKLYFQAAVVLVLLAACLSGPGGLTPEGAVLKMLQDSGDEQSQVTHTVDAANGSVVLYQNPAPVLIPGDPSRSYTFGYAYLEQEKGRWWVRSGRFGIYTPEQGVSVIFMVLRFPEGDGLRTGPHIPFGEIGDVSNLPESETGSLLVIGKVLDEAINEIQVTDSAATVWSAPVHQSMFAIVLQEEHLPCQLRAANENREYLEGYSFSELPEWQVSSQLSEQIQRVCRASNE